MPADVQTFKNVMSHWVSGISVITTTTNGDWQGFTANSFASVSVEPLLISMSVVKGMYAGERLLESGIFVVNILTQEQAEWGKLFAGMYPERTNRFEGIQCTPADNGSPILPDVLGWMACRIYQTLDVGASTLVLGEVTDAYISETGDPLAYYHRQWGRFTPLT